MVANDPSGSPECRNLWGDSHRSDVYRRGDATHRPRWLAHVMVLVHMPASLSGLFLVYMNHPTGWW